MIKPSCFINQDENLEKSLIKPIKTHSKIKPQQPIETGGIILCRLLVSFYIGVETLFCQDVILT